MGRCRTVIPAALAHLFVDLFLEAHPRPLKQIVLDLDATDDPLHGQQEQSAVLRLLRGEDLELVSRELAVPAAEVSAWRDAFLAAGEASLKTRPADGRDAEIGRLKAKVGDLTMANELLEVKIGHLEAGRPLPRRRSRR